MDATVNRLIHDIYELIDSVPLGRFKAAVFERVRSVLEFSSGVWAEGEATFPLVIPHGVYLYNLPGDLLDHYRRFAEEDVLYRAVVAHPNRTFLATDLIPQAQYLQSPFYREYGRRFGIADAIATSMVQQELGLYSFVVFYRPENRPPFGEEERRVKQLLMPHLMTAYRIKLFQAILAQETAVDHHAVSAVIDAHGVIYQASPGLVAMMRQIWNDWRGPELPSPVIEALQAERSCFFIESLFFTLTPLPDVLWFLKVHRMNRIDVLSASECRVAFLLSQGWTYKEVGRSLGISPSTVTNHVNHIYKKLNISSKGELRRFFFP